ncbi:hypothetical protein [Roseivivax sediminis]|uniref:Uncharacterized protein n=1 Tax=Roseivivax sediminis TaxID=936889 RepID=A0A1I2D3K2_9RHOB|nr:hypothetical protein [Roseivivax sediminis]SFE75096.1 hypothetical protein SAMN04515678_11554 [Roseivivax sediminis]
MRSHTVRDFTLCKAVLLAALIGIGHLSLALEARGEMSETAFSLKTMFDCGSSRSV